jgi:hypothetical protein
LAAAAFLLAASAVFLAFFAAAALAAAAFSFALSNTAICTGTGLAGNCDKSMGCAVTCGWADTCLTQSAAVPAMRPPVTNRKIPNQRKLTCRIPSPLPWRAGHRPLSGFPLIPVIFGARAAGYYLKLLSR